MTPDERIAVINIKVDRAKQHIVELGKAITSFFESEPYKIGTKHDPKTRKLIYYLAFVQPVPSNISCIVGDIIHNLKSALDHLAYQLFLIGNNGSGGNERDICFPFVDTTTVDGLRAFEQKTAGMRPKAKEALLKIEAYENGKGHALWQLHKLSIIDKHLTLVPVILSGGYSVDLGAHISPFVEKTMGVSGFTLPPMFVQAAETEPLKEGYELLIDDVDGVPNKNMKFKFKIGLHKSQIIEGKSIEVLEEFTNLVSSTIVSFKPLLQQDYLSSASASSAIR